MGRRCNVEHERAEAAEQQLTALRAVVQQIVRYAIHKRNCKSLCVECGGSRFGNRHREGWIPGSGVFWHDFTPAGACDCGLDTLAAALTTEPDTDAQGCRRLW